MRIPFNPGAAALRYEHSMGQGLPDLIHRMSRENDRRAARAEAATQ